MRAWLIRFGYVIWPPARAIHARRCIDRDLEPNPLKRFAAIQSDVEEALSEIASKEELLREAASVTEIESRRKETIESKATSYLLAFSVVTGLVSGYLALLGADSRLPAIPAILLAVLYGLTVIHFLNAVYHAILTRQAEALAVPLVEDVLELASKPGDVATRRLVSALTRAKFNQPLLTKKANHLSVAETMFLRGLALMGATTIVALVAQLLNEIGYC